MVVLRNLRWTTSDTLQFLVQSKEELRKRQAPSGVGVCVHWGEGERMMSVEEEVVVPVRTTLCYRSSAPPWYRGQKRDRLIRIR